MKKKKNICVSVCNTLISLVQYSAATIFSAVIVALNTFLMASFLKCRFRYTLNLPMFARLVAINLSKFVVFEALSNK